MLRLMGMGTVTLVGMGAAISPDLPPLASFGVASSMIGILLWLLHREQNDRKALHRHLADEAKQRQDKMDAAHEKNAEILTEIVRSQQNVMTDTAAALRENAEATRDHSKAFQKISETLAVVHDKAERR